MKSTVWYLSKTLWFNVIVVILIIAYCVSKIVRNEAFTLDEILIIIGVLGGGNVGLRTITNKPLSMTKKNEPPK